MRILLVYTGRSLATGGQNLKRQLLNLSTTHTSEVFDLHIAYQLRQKGHQVLTLLEDSSRNEQDPSTVTLSSLNPTDFDVLLLLKIHGLRFAARHQLLKRSWFRRCRWRRVVAWLDATQPDNILKNFATSISGIAWATSELYSRESFRHPCRQIVLEQATSFAEPPTIAETELRGVFLGRLPEPYLEHVLEATKHSPMRVFALWVKWEGKKLRFRPSQFDTDVFTNLKNQLPPNLDLCAAVNVHRQANQISRAAFALCPAMTPTSPQCLSASKFYDYLALGLPVVTADNVPEAALVRTNPQLGILYDPRCPESLGHQLRKALARAEQADFFEQRLEIQKWVFQHATYQLRVPKLETLFTDI